MKKYQLLLKIFSSFLLLSSCQKEDFVKQSIPTLDISQAASKTKSNLKFGKVKDIDGNTYRTVQIGTQIWMAENLKVTRYKNGTPIPELLDDISWSSTTTGARCNPYNDQSLIGTYGRYYNWYTVIDPRGLAPKGWHIPTEAEWLTLISFLGGESVAGGKMKSITNDWGSPNFGATNLSGYSGVPSGNRAGSGWAYSVKGVFAHWWTSTGHPDNRFAWFHTLSYDNEAAGIQTYAYKNDGLAIRCIKD
jgi:hypothetical protein